MLTATLVPGEKYKKSGFWYGVVMFHDISSPRALRVVEMVTDVLLEWVPRRCTASSSSALRS